MSRWPPPEYRVHVVFRAPRDFVFRWCTDYRSDDGKRCGEPFVRKVLERTSKTFVLQDLWTTPKGWFLNQNRTTLFPPSRWHVDSYGNHRILSIDYSLTELPRNRTRLELHVRRKPTKMYPEQPSRRAYESNLTLMWRRFARSLEEDYRTRAKRRRS
jgi:hypothetical protein